MAVRRVFCSYLNLLVNVKDDLAVALTLDVPSRSLGRQAFTDLKRAAHNSKTSLFLVRKLTEPFIVLFFWRFWRRRVNITKLVFYFLENEKIRISFFFFCCCWWWFLQAATSFVRAIQLGGKGYAPAESDPLRKHVKGLSDFVQFLDNLEEILGEVPDPWYAASLTAQRVKTTFCFHRDVVSKEIL